MNDLPNKEQAHDDEFVSKIYRASAQDNPPQALNDAVLSMAKKHNHTRPTKILPWWKKMQYQGAVAACITIICVVYIFRPLSLQIETNNATAASNLMLEPPSPEPLPSSPAVEDVAALESISAARSRDVMRSAKIEQTDVSKRIASVTTMSGLESIHSEGVAIVKSQLVQGLLLENDEIITVLAELKSTLELNHTQIMQRISEEKSGELDPLLNRYRKQHESLITNLSELFKVLPDFEPPQAYEEFVSEKDIKALKAEM